jgi:hypothetical protein
VLLFRKRSRKTKGANEEFIAGREFTIGVFNRREIITLPFTEVKTHKEFSISKVKYTPE